MYVCACLRACVRACVCVCACVRIEVFVEGLQEEHSNIYHILTSQISINSDSIKTDNKQQLKLKSL